MRSRFDYLNRAALQAQSTDALATIGAAMRRASAQMIEQTRATPAPCGCAPKIRCDRHCRVKIRYHGSEYGVRYWVASCNGADGDERCRYAYDRMFCGDLRTLQDWAIAHVTEHRSARLVGMGGDSDEA
jgi:hypothetical protein